MARDLVSLTVMFNGARSFGALGLTLAGVGLYGLLSFQVARRTREFGVRSALGSRPRDTVSLVFRESWALVGAGLLSGIFGAMLLSRFLQSQLHDVPAIEPVSYLGAGLALIVSTAFATGLPALRAARVEPVVALRED